MTCRPSMGWCEGTDTGYAGRCSARVVHVRAWGWRGERVEPVMCEAQPSGLLEMWETMVDE